jgi:hypothetical protein
MRYAVRHPRCDDGITQLHACEASPAARAQAARWIRCVGLVRHSQARPLSTLSPLARRRWGYWQAPAPPPASWDAAQAPNRQSTLLPFFFLGRHGRRRLRVCICKRKDSPQRCFATQRVITPAAPRHAVQRRSPSASSASPLVSPLSPRYADPPLHSIAARCLPCPAQSTRSSPTQAPAYAY